MRWQRLEKYRSTRTNSSHSFVFCDGHSQYEVLFFGSNVSSNAGSWGHLSTHGNILRVYFLYTTPGAACCRTTVYLGGGPLGGGPVGGGPCGAPGA